MRLRKDLILSVLVVIGMMEEYVTHLMNMNVGHGMPVQCLVMLCSKLLTGIQYDAVDSTLYIDSRIGDDFTSFLSTETGFGNVGLKRW